MNAIALKKPQKFIFTVARWDYIAEESLRIKWITFFKYNRVGIEKILKVTLWFVVSLIL